MTMSTHNGIGDLSFDACTATASPTASIRRVFSSRHHPSSPHTPGAFEILSRQADLQNAQKQPLKGGEGLAIHKIQLFFKGVSESLHLQDEINRPSPDTASITDSKNRHEKENLTITQGTSGRHKENDYSSSQVYDEISEDLKDHSDLPTQEKSSKYDVIESHPFFDGRFIEIDGLVQYDPDWREKQREAAKIKRRDRRRLSAWGQNIVATKAA